MLMNFFFKIKYYINIFLNKNILKNKQVILRINKSIGFSVFSLLNVEGLMSF